MRLPTRGAISAIPRATARRSASAPNPCASVVAAIHRSASGTRSPRLSRTRTSATAAADAWSGSPAWKPFFDPSARAMASKHPESAHAGPSTTPAAFAASSSMRASRRVPTFDRHPALASAEEQRPRTSVTLRTLAPRVIRQTVANAASGMSSGDVSSSDMSCALCSTPGSTLRA